MPSVPLTSSPCGGITLAAGILRCLHLVPDGRQWTVAGAACATVDASERSAPSGPAVGDVVRRAGLPPGAPVGIGLDADGVLVESIRLTPRDLAADGAAVLSAAAECFGPAATTGQVQAHRVGRGVCGDLAGDEWILWSCRRSSRSRWGAALAAAGVWTSRFEASAVAGARQARAHWSEAMVLAVGRRQAVLVIQDGRRILHARRLACSAEAAVLASEVEQSLAYCRAVFAVGSPRGMLLTGDVPPSLIETIRNRLGVECLEADAGELPAAGATVGELSPAWWVCAGLATGAGGDRSSPLPGRDEMILANRAAAS